MLHSLALHWHCFGFCNVDTHWKMRLWFYAGLTHQVSICCHFDIGCWQACWCVRTRCCCCCAEWARRRRQCGPGHRALRRTEGPWEGEGASAARWWVHVSRVLESARRDSLVSVGHPSTLTFCQDSLGDAVVWSWRQEPACRWRDGVGGGRPRNVPFGLPVTIHLLSRALLRQSLALGCDHFLHFSRAPKCEQASNSLFHLYFILCATTGKEAPHLMMFSAIAASMFLVERPLASYPQKIMDSDPPCLRLYFF